MFCSGGATVSRIFPLRLPRPAFGRPEKPLSASPGLSLPAWIRMIPRQKPGCLPPVLFRSFPEAPRFLRRALLGADQEDGSAFADPPSELGGKGVEQPLPVFVGSYRGGELGVGRRSDIEYFGAPRSESEFAISCWKQPAASSDFSGSS